jgi:dTMP kinase
VFIVIDGPEGCGKSTQADLAAKALAEEGVEVVVARDPGGTPLGEAVRQALLHAEHPVCARAEMLLFMASRAQLVNEVIRPALADDKTVICKRYVSSTLAYQGYAGGEDIDTIAHAGRYATDGLTPDLTVVIDVDAAVGLARVKSPDNIEKRGEEYHEKVRRGFLELAGQNADTYVVVDGSRSVQEVHEDIMRAIEARKA